MKVKVILTVMKQLKELQKKPRKKSEASTGFEPVTSTILAEIIGMVQITEKPLHTIPTILVKVILTVMKQLKQLQRKPRKKI